MIEVELSGQITVVVEDGCQPQRSVVLGGSGVSVDIGPVAPGQIVTFPFIDLNMTLDPPSQPGRIHWDPTTGTLSVGMPGGNVVLQVGQEQLARVRNKTGAPILNGQIVYVSGATGQTPEVTPASASSYDESIRTIAMATEDIADNAFGYVNTFGIVRDLDTDGIPEGTIIFLGEEGAYTPTRPVYPINQIAVGICIYENKNNGQVFFFPRIVYRKFGTPAAGNFTGVDDAGHVINYGSGRTWNDLPPIPLLVQRQGAANNPTLAAFLGNLQQLTFAVNDYVYGNYEILHEYAEGTDLSPHVHMVTNGTDTTNRAVKWELEYSISNGGSVAPFSEIFPATVIITGETRIPANTPAKAHIIATDMPVIPGAGIKIGAYIVWRLRRVAASIAAPTLNPFGLTLGFHVLQDTQGSDQIGQKTIVSLGD